MQIVIGIDPDSQAHGVAIYIDGELWGLYQWCMGEIIEYCILEIGLDNQVSLSIEDVKINKFIYTRNQKQSKSAQSAVGISVGKCQQSQIELERELDRRGIKYVNFKPQKGNWAENKAQFEKVTSWEKRSNKDTRSAAFFGYLALKRNTPAPNQ